MILTQNCKRCFKPELLYLFSQEFKDNKIEKSLLELGSGTGESFKMISKKLSLKKFT